MDSDEVLCIQEQPNLKNAKTLYKHGAIFTFLMLRVKIFCKIHYQTLCFYCFIWQRRSLAIPGCKELHQNPFRSSLNNVIIVELLVQISNFRRFGSRFFAEYLTRRCVFIALSGRGGLWLSMDAKNSNRIHLEPA